MTPAKAARALEALLTARGLGDGLLRAEQAPAGMSVLSARCGLTVWCRDSMNGWPTRAGGL